MGHSMSFQWGRWWHSSLSDKPIYCTQYKKKRIGTISLQLSTFIAANIFVGHVFWALGRLQAGLQCRLGTHRQVGKGRGWLQGAFCREVTQMGSYGIKWDPPWCSWSFFQLLILNAIDRSDRCAIFPAEVLSSPFVEIDGWHHKFPEKNGHTLVCLKIGHLKTIWMDYQHVIKTK